ncbi:hypothetical protein ASA1KI_17270 [Opitutales bacterium ASA1]|uniref:plastocyanin/azurin family copper-binding protein n=1 Tax=Congregicoccus parvus TaxID=3081749 RepID=UPI002B27C427|nr:hypothetical protein ASA1KI_17270 [Opitutales bacterium ASA1]
MQLQRLVLVPFLAFALALATGCGSKAPTGNTSSGSPGGGRPVEITANDRMIFSVSEIRAKPGEKLSVTLVNTGSMPKQAMGHNWVLLLQGTNVMDFNASAALAASTEYIPEKFKEAVVAHTRMLGPKERDTITFDAPTISGRHVFLCSFPGHFQVGMKGVVIVE